MITDSSTIAIPITASARQQAQQFAQEQANPAKQRQVYRNTLAVCAVQTYLQWMEVTVDCDRSFSYQPRERFCLDVADLYLPGIGRLECRPVEFGARDCAIPIEVQSERLGYVAVAIDEANFEARLLGFAKNAADSIALSQLGNLDDLLVALEPPMTQLSQWFQAQFAQHWRSFQELIESTNTPAPMVAYMHRAGTLTAGDRETQIAQLLQQLAAANDEESRWKTIEKLWTIAPEHPATGVRRIVDLGLYLDGEKLALMMAILPNPDRSVSVLLRVYPMAQQYLPEGVTLAAVEAFEKAFEIQSRSGDNYIQMKFSAQPGEQFGVQVRNGAGEFIEHFVV
jgi:hypothetical protein